MKGLSTSLTKSLNCIDGRLFLSLTFIIIFSMLIGVVLVPQSAYSHANPTSYSPASNSVIAQDGTLPDKVVIAYTERPEPKASYIRVTNSENERVDKNDYTISPNNPRESSVSVDTSKLKPGVYTVSWLALSMDDGHITRGSYVFTLSSASNTTQSGGVVMTGNNFTDSVVVDNVNITLKISPFYSGINNNFTVSLSDQNENAPSNIKTLFLIFSNKQAGLGPITTELNKVNGGVFSGSGAYLSQPGEWEAKLTVQRTDAYDLNHDFALDIQAPS
jgi:methionine-rich copper-binding protein CopC